MATFSLNDYETVEERIRRLYADEPLARIITKNLTTELDRARGQWIVKAEIWLPLADPELEKVNFSKMPGAFLKATGLAFEIDGQGMANKTSALENAETSAIGRALANAGYSGNKRASREEMAKVARASQRDWLGEADKLALAYDVDGLRLLYTEAVAAKVAPAVLEQIKAHGSAAKP